MTDRSVAGGAEPGDAVHDGEARKFLADKDDDQFDFQQWYEQQLDDFQADQDNVAYDDDEDRPGAQLGFTDPL
ncbi:MAG TPA: hypothetical protein VFW21_01445 [Mycobacterium sp.]|nr:hypothetical protein [Mycobacterium sp.]